jgi:Zn-dependent M28 family amino/carboxypeptidase
MDLTENLSEHLQQIVRLRDPYLNSGGHFFVREYIREELQKYGKMESHEFNYNNRSHQNLILNLPSRDGRNFPPIAIGAHYDAVPGSPGADDNATGVVVLLELARIFAAQPVKFPLRLIAFDLEEYGLIGSYTYAQKLKQEKQPLRLMLSLEMLGYRDRSINSQRYPVGLQYFYPTTGDFIALIGNLSALFDLINLRRIIKKMGTACEYLPVPFQGKSIKATRLSDHSPFWDAGYSAVMVTDTAFMRNPHYHQSTDTIESLDLDFLTGVCLSLITAISQLK